MWLRLYDRIQRLLHRSVGPVRARRNAAVGGSRSGGHRKPTRLSRFARRPAESAGPPAEPPPSADPARSSGSAGFISPVGSMDSVDSMGSARSSAKRTPPDPGPPSPMQPPAGLQPPSGARSPVAPWPAGPAASPSAAERLDPSQWSDGTQRSGAAQWSGAARTRTAGGGAGRGRVREAPYGAAPVAQTQPGSPAGTAESDRAVPNKAQRDAGVPDTGQPGAAGQAARNTVPRQPWYRVIGPPGAGKTRGRPSSLSQTARADGPDVDEQGARQPGGRGAAAGQSAYGQHGNEQGAGARGRANGPGAVERGAAPANRAARGPGQSSLPYTAPHPEGLPRPASGDGRANCGPLEKILWRQWEQGAVPHPQAVAAVERLASFPRALQEKLADGLTGIYVGAGGVPELDHMDRLRGVPLPSGRATWDACAGAYGERKIVIGTKPSPTPDVICHEVGHALDDLDSPPGKWQSDSAEFRLIYDQCKPYLASDFHRQRGGLGSKEFFADSFAAIASAQRPALVDMLGGNTRVALRVMLYFNRRYGI